MSAPAYKEPAVAPVAALRHRKAGRVNFVIESATPAMLCLVRAAQPRPYTPLSSEDLFEAVQPYDLSLRPSPFTAHQALLDFYKVCDGYHGVVSEEVDLQQLTVGSHGKSSSQQQQQQQQHHVSGSGGVAALVLAPSFSAAAAAAAGSGQSSSSASLLPPLPSPDDPNIAEKLNDYRIAQLRRNAQHVDNKAYHAGNTSNSSGGSSSSTATTTTTAGNAAGVCHFYRTPGGCHRGAHCPFAHLEKGAQGPVKGPFATGRK